VTPFLIASLSLALSAGQDFNYIAVDVRTREVVVASWPDADVPIPVGSLVKPFTALAFPGAFPEFQCQGAANRCWRAKPHGELNIVDALAQSCNAYFLQLAAGVDADALAVVAATFGIPPPKSNTPEARIGLGDGWRISPLALTRAYAELAMRSHDPRADQLLTGLERAARTGTAQGISRPGDRVLAKTGTAPCAAPRPHKGDGFALVLYPAEAPRTALLVRVHNVPGAEAAKTAAKVMRGLREGH
jgi:cell division protein FtsI/penicillin-binding protein 2